MNPDILEYPEKDAFFIGLPSKLQLNRRKVKEKPPI
jgi:hypothetical protein